MIDEFAKVVAIHPESHSVDCLVLRTGARLAGVPVMSGAASGQTGLADLHMPDAAKGFDSENTGERDIVAVLSYYRELPFVVGFIFPQVSQCLFERPDFRVSRHASDVYSTVDAHGNMEICHPSGAFVRIAESPAHEDLTGKDYDKIWNVARNTGRAVHIHVEQAGGVATVNIAPDGTVTVTSAATITTTSTGETTVNAAHVTVNASALQVNGHINTTGNITADGNISAKGTIKDLMASGGKTMDSMRTAYGGHSHADAHGGTVGTPTPQM